MFDSSQFDRASRRLVVASAGNDGPDVGGIDFNIRLQGEWIDVPIAQ